MQPTTALSGALFGFSIDAGDITGDSIPDIIISAPMDSYQTSAVGLLGDVNVDITAGKVYVYRSEDLFSSANPAPFLQLRLQGSNYFSTGVLGLLNNTSVKALFGFSIAVTDDLNGDNKKDIVIGAPAYVGISLLAAQSGAAFVYYSDNLSTTTPVKLNVPTPSILGLITLPLANLNGLLYGFSVDGAGDYNNDGHPDVVVGAPAGVDLSSLGGIFSGQILGGSAYVYYSNGTSISPSIGASLQASPSGLLSNAANLFGYKVKGTRGANRCKERRHTYQRPGRQCA
ncbi:MAG: integrin alpha [Bacteroidota bacterium]